VKKTSFIEFDPIYFVCTREYPVIAQKFEIDTDDKSFVNSKSTMGAPLFKETGNANADYSWEDRNREKLKDTRWVNSLVELPMVKFQIVFSKVENRSDLFIGDKGELKQNISPEELAKKMNILYNKLDGSFYYNIAKAYLKQIGYADLGKRILSRKLIIYCAICRTSGMMEFPANYLHPVLPNVLNFARSLMILSSPLRQHLPNRRILFSEPNRNGW
jgi:hypothetical protein